MKIFKLKNFLFFLFLYVYNSICSSLKRKLENTNIISNLNKEKKNFCLNKQIDVLKSNTNIEFTWLYIDKEDEFANEKEIYDSFDYKNFNMQKLDYLKSICNLVKFKYTTNKYIENKYVCEVTASHIEINFDYEIICRIKKDIESFFRFENLIIKRYNLIIYSNGYINEGIKKEYAKTETIIGTLLLFLPGNIEGGMLDLKNREDNKYHLNWDNKTKKISWICFSSQYKYNITDVLEGNRIILTYDIYNKNTTDCQGNNCFKLKNNIFCEKANKELNDLKHFITNFKNKYCFRGQKYGYVPTNKYKLNIVDNDFYSLESFLTGFDLLFYRFLKLNGFVGKFYIIYMDRIYQKLEENNLKNVKYGDQYKFEMDSSMEICTCDIRMTKDTIYDKKDCTHWTFFQVIHEEIFARLPSLNNVYLLHNLEFLKGEVMDIYKCYYGYFKTENKMIERYLYGRLIFIFEVKQ